MSQQSASTNAGNTEYRFPFTAIVGQTAMKRALLLNAVKNYGGCEVLALPSLLFRRWYTVYCPLNAIDAAERAVRGVGGARAPEARGT